MKQKKSAQVLNLPSKKEIPKIGIFSDSSKIRHPLVICNIQNKKGRIITISKAKYCLEKEEHPIYTRWKNKMSIKVIREVFGCNSKIHAGYDQIGVTMAVEFLDYNANQEAKSGKLTIRKNDSSIDGKNHFERILSDSDGNDVIRYSLRFDSLQGPTFAR